MVRLGAKGQIVIPKILREAYKLYPYGEAVIRAEEDGMVIKKPQEKIMEKFKDLAQRMNVKTKLNAQRIKEVIEQQYEERAKRAGIKTKK